MPRRGDHLGVDPMSALRDEFEELQHGGEAALEDVENRLAQLEAVPAGAASGPPGPPPPRVDAGARNSALGCAGTAAGDFAQKLEILSQDNSAVQLPLASEACLSGAGLVAQIESRLDRLREAGESPDLMDFIEIY